MASLRVPGGSTRGRSGKERPSGRGDLFPFLRRSHIFASTVQEILQRKLLREATPHALSLSQFHLLKLICGNGTHAVGQVAGILGVSAPAATKNIDKLERLGLVARQRSAEDRRTTLLSTSTAGRKLVGRYERLKAARLQAALAGFEHEEVEGFARMLERFSISMLGGEPGGDGHCLRCAAYIEAGCPVGVIRGGCPYELSRVGHWNRAAAAAAGARSRGGVK